MTHPHIVIVGGGAAGFYAAITAATANSRTRVSLYEKSRHFLGKVRISGGGRCNVTHACFDPSHLAAFYPRGARELRAAFHRWQPRDTVDWFERHGVSLKTEADGRIFPVTDDSGTVIDALTEAARRAGVRLCPGTGISALSHNGRRFLLTGNRGERIDADCVCVTTGSIQSSALCESLANLGHTIEPPVPSLFSFHIRDPRIEGLQGVSVDPVQVRLFPSGTPQSGPLLITHNGMSGPAILRLSAWEARTLQSCDYRFEISLAWTHPASSASLREETALLRKRSGNRTVKNTPMGRLPRRLWERLTEAAGIESDETWSQLGRVKGEALFAQLTDGRFAVDGKTLNKEEFVTCGGIRLKEVDFRTMESRIQPGLFFGGECLDLDGLTGGFNLQAAWTTGFLAGHGMASRSAAAT